MSGEDANPLNRRLPAEVVTRQKREVKKIVENNDEVQVDLKTALSLKPEARVKWLSKALRMVEDKRASSTELYDIVSNRKFCATMHTRNSQRLRGLILDNLSIFSEKQRRFLRSDEWAPNKLFEEEDIKEAEEEDRKLSPSVKRDGRPERLTERAVEKVDGRREGRAAEGQTDGKAEMKRKVDANTKRSEDKSGDAEKDAGGGWTFTIRERPMPDPLTSGKKRRKGAEDSEARFEAMAEKNEASLKKQEEDVDSSLALLERLQQTHTPQEKERSKRVRSPKKRDQRHRHLSRSKSISAASVTSSDDRGKRSRGKKRKGRSRSRERAGGGGVSFEEALRRRMQQRDSEMETSRMPVVDPGHAKKNWR
ncbi:unnamed protein product [Cladocopium goreaui]|uniref:RING-type domain-containing protein n=1 Tax=Cladocopium goreaui TaxID=2562237 RepID=A0A9P1CWT2_9DINO|nr:unnamed protein product [Cladocopium goreaui]